MELSTILVTSAWAGLFALSAGVLFTAPARFIGPTFLCGAVGRSVRDALLGLGLGPGWSTAVAVVVLVLAAAAVVRKHSVPPIVLLGGILPLTSSVSLINAILELLKIPSLEGEALAGATVALSANIGKLFTTFLAIALGLAAGMAIVRLLRGEEFWERV